MGFSHGLGRECNSESCSDNILRVAPRMAFHSDWFLFFSSRGVSQFLKIFLLLFGAPLPQSQLPSKFDGQGGEAPGLCAPNRAIWLRLEVVVFSRKSQAARHLDDRAENRGLDSCGVGTANLGFPIFCCPRLFRNPFKHVRKLGANKWRPKFADATPHLSNPHLLCPLILASALRFVVLVSDCLAEVQSAKKTTARSVQSP